MDLLQSMLENKIRRYQDAYYKGAPEISDAEFDALWDELAEKYPKSKLLKGVGSDLDRATPGKKYRHLMTMGSQDKFNSPEDLHKWLVSEDIQFPVDVSLKLDGISIELQYQKGELVCALTRGDGYEGELIPHAGRMNGVPVKGVVHSDGEPFTGAVRGEVLISRQLFEKKYAAEFKNPRNFVAGSVKNENFRNWSDLDVVTYDVYCTRDNYYLMAREDRKLEFLSRAGFIPVSHWLCPREQDILNLYNSKNPKSEKYNIDGLVIKQNLYDFKDMEELRPKKQRAFKWKDEGEETVLLDVEWSRSGTTFTPVAILDPVDIDGSTVSRASLANPSLIRDLGLQIGDTVLVTKRGMIIPKIEKVVSHASPSVAKKIDVPVQCPICGCVLQADEKKLFCPNHNCEGKDEHRIAKWLNVLDVKGFGTVMQDALYDYKITSIPDLYDPEKTNKMIREYGSITCEKAFRDLYAKSQEITLEQLFAGFDMEGIGVELIGELVKAGYDTVDKILNLRLEQIVAVNNWSTSRATDLLIGLCEIATDVQKLIRGNFITLKEKDVSGASEGPLSGLHVCVTGKLEHYSRKQIEDLLKKNGAIVDGGVSSKTDILVTNDQTSGSSKLKNAQKFGTKIISEKELSEMIS